MLSISICSNIVQLGGRFSVPNITAIVWLWVKAMSHWECFLLPFRLFPSGVARVNLQLMVFCVLFSHTNRLNVLLNCIHKSLLCSPGLPVPTSASSYWEIHYPHLPCACPHRASLPSLALSLHTVETCQTTGRWVFQIKASHSGNLNYELPQHSKKFHAAKHSSKKNVFIQKILDSMSLSDNKPGLPIFTWEKTSVFLG